VPSVTQHLSRPAHAAIGQIAADVLVSVATPWEIAIKVRSRGWPEAEPLLLDFENAIAEEGFKLLPIAVDHVRRAGLMTAAHRDPSDRLLAAQVEIEGLTLVTADARLTGLGAATL